MNNDYSNDLSTKLLTLSGLNYAQCMGIWNFVEYIKKPTLTKCRLESALVNFKTAYSIEKFKGFPQSCGGEKVAASFALLHQYENLNNKDLLISMFNYQNYDYYTKEIKNKLVLFEDETFIKG